VPSTPLKKNFGAAPPRTHNQLNLFFPDNRVSKI
jgi:hypothetical protein